MYGWARVAWVDGDLDAAVADLKVVIKLDPGRPFATRLLAQIVT